MRWALNRLALAITSMVALAFLVPLAVVTRQLAHDRAIGDARQQAAAMVAALAVDADPQLLTRAVVSTAAGSEGRLAVHLPDVAPVGVVHATAADVTLAAGYRRPVTADAGGGLAYLLPTVIGDGRTAVIEVYVPREDMERGVWRSWLALAVLAVVLVGGSTVVADRLGSRIVRATRRLAGAARQLGTGDLTARVTPDGPAELRDAAQAFNGLAQDMRRLIDAERELAADLSHRLRTPLTALRLDAEAMPPGPIGERMRQACDLLDEELEAIITGARRSVGERGAESADLVEVLADRLAFWSVLAEDQQRPWTVVGGDRPVPLPLPRGDLILAVDALLGNVFAHTPEGSAFRVTVSPDGLVVDDAGAGIADPAAAVRRGASGAGSTGLGLDIVQRVATAAGGRLDIGRGPLGGARVALILAADAAPDSPSGPGERRRRAGRA
ncbi:sensor histidine kinase [Micromonospora thermarum]|uniref:histidine kinase n=1 Tax=Micromonospora thermarum TaxID=2720024 RepID=A0ABX0Z9G6_9ACTN|nr:HAMP domain-containing sensor histidine kinase [Micromonospora thermarum]NJP34526.1 HAMP domain-containing histidine kinase [Micromonospora thermarum]